MEISSAVLASITAIVLSLLFSYIPGLRTWYAGKSDEFKKLFMLGLLAVVSGSIFALGCFNLLAVDLTCDKDGAIKLVTMFVLALTANQATFMITPTATDVRDLKTAEREAEIRAVKKG